MIHDLRDLRTSTVHPGRLAAYVELARESRLLVPTGFSPLA